MFGPSVREALAGLGGDLQVAIPLDRVQQVRVAGGAIAPAERLLGSYADTGTGCWPALPRGRVRPLAWRRARRRTGQHSPSPASPSTSAATRRRVRKLG